MVDNQHQKISGYRDLSQEEIDLMNEIKAKASECGELCDKLKRCASQQNIPGDPQLPRKLDGRWVAIGTTHLQEGFMSLVRSVAQPTTF